MITRSLIKLIFESLLWTAVLLYMIRIILLPLTSECDNECDNDEE